MKKSNYLILIYVLFAVLILLGIVQFKCPWLLFTGKYCAGCGVTRMIRSIFMLDFYQAFRYNPLFFILLVLLLIYGLYVGICLFFKKKYFKLNTKCLIPIVVLLVIFMILRNTELFGFLRPTVVS